MFFIYFTTWWCSYNFLPKFCDYMYNSSQQYLIFSSSSLFLVIFFNESQTLNVCKNTQLTLKERYILCTPPQMSGWLLVFPQHTFNRGLAFCSGTQSNISPFIVYCRNIKVLPKEIHSSPSHQDPLARV